jgi:hypothetical protein
MTEQEKWLRQILLQVIPACPHCHRRFEDRDIRVLGRQEQTWMLSLHCPGCHILALIGIGVASDLEPEEIARFREVPPISADEVLDLHLLLKEYRGDLRGLIEGKTEEPPR